MQAIARFQPRLQCMEYPFATVLAPVSITETASENTIPDQAEKPCLRKPNV